MTGIEAYTLATELEKIFDVVRFVDPKAKRVIHIDEKGILTDRGESCHKFWGREKECENCVSARACEKKLRHEKFEFVNDTRYHVICSPIEIEEKIFSVETIAKKTNEVMLEAYSDDKFADLIEGIQERLYKDPLTEILNRRYFEENIEYIRQLHAIATIDVDNFKDVNDIYGHAVGDLALKAVARCIRSHMRASDIIIRMGGDEFLLAFNEIPKETFVNKLDTIRQAVTEIELHEVPELSLSISLGGVYDSYGFGVDFDKSDDQLYTAKLRKNAVVIEDKFITEDINERTLGIYGLTEENARPENILMHHREMAIIKKQNAVISGFSDSLECACYISQKNKNVICFQMSDWLKGYIDENDEKLSFTEKSKKLFKKIVHEDDLQRFNEATSQKRVMAELEEDGIYFHDFRAKDGDKTRYYRIKFIQDKDDPDGVLFGLVDIDENKREEKRRAEEDTLQRMMEIVGALDDDALAVFVIDSETGKVKTLFNNDSFVEFVYREDGKLEDFFVDVLNLLNKFIYEPDKGLLQEYLDKERLKKEIEETGASQVEYRLLVEDELRWYQLRTVFAEKEDKRTLLAGIFAIDRLHRADKERLSLNAFVEKYESVFRVDLENDILHIFKRGQLTKQLLGNEKREEVGFSKSVELFIEYYVPEEDRDRLLKEVSTDVIRQNLKENISYTVTFKMHTPEGFRYFEVSATRLNRDEQINECIIGIMENDEVILKNSAIRKILNEFYSAYIIDLRTGEYRNIHRVGGFGLDWGKKGDFDYVMARERPFIHPDDWSILEKVSSAKRLNKYVTEGMPEEILYRTASKTDPWEKCIIRCLDEHKGEPVHVLIAFAPVEHTRGKELDYQQKQHEMDCILRQCILMVNSGVDADVSIQALVSVAAEYYDARQARVYEVDEELETIASVCEWDCAKNIYGDSHPNRSAIPFIKEHISIMKSEGELNIVGSNDNENTVAVPFMEKDRILGFVALTEPKKNTEDISLLRYVGAFIQGEQLRKMREEIEDAEQAAVISVLADDFDGVSYVTVFKDKEDDVSENYRLTSELAEAIPGWMHEKRFKKQIAMMRNTMVHPEDRNDFIKGSSREVIIKELSKEKAYTVNFRAVIDNTIKHYQLKFVADRDNRGKLRGLVAGIRNIDIDIRKERERQVELEKIVEERTQEIGEKNERLNRVNEEIVDMFAELTEARDVESGAHIRRVRGLTEILARQVMEDFPEYGLTDEKIRLIASASALHDVGKIMIPDAILLKQGKLTEEEFEEMKTHCMKGCQIISKSPADWSREYIQIGMEICRWHHEKYDGNGYPDGLAGDEIPISAQIVSLVDCFDALISRRVYKEPYKCNDAIDMINNGECGIFSPKILKSFVKCKQKVYAYASDINKNAEKRIALEKKSMEEMAIKLEGGITQ